MFISKIDISDILGSRNVTLNTPIIVLSNVPSWYLISVCECEKIYRLDTNKLHNDLEKRVQFIHNFIPIGQIQFKKNENPKRTKFTILLSNEKIIPSTHTFENLTNNVWIAIIHDGANLNRSIGTIYSERKPDIAFPVFPKSFLIKYNNDDNQCDLYDNIYYHHNYGKWMLNKFAFNIDKKHLKIINSTGDIDDMFIPSAYSPTSDISITDVIYDKKNTKGGDRKVYFTTQGDISIDSNCIPERETLNKMTINECNASHNNIVGFSDNDTTSNGCRENISDNLVTKKSKWLQRKKTIVLKERDEPWFLNSTIVGDVLHTTDPHKVSGAVNLIGTVYGDTEEINLPFESDCVNDNTIGYSRADKKRKCSGIEMFDDSTDCHESTNINDIIFLSICVIILIIIFSQKK